MDSPTLTLLGGLGLLVLFASALAMVGLRRLVSASDPVHERLQVYGLLPADEPARQARNRSGLARFRVRLNALLSSLGSESLALQLARANWPITVPEYVLIRLASTFGALLLGWVLGQHPIPGVGMAIIAYFVPVFLMQRNVSQRQTQFARQLVDVLVLLTGAVRSGHSLLQAMEVVVHEMRPPASDEFRRVVREVGLGRRLPDALRNLASRMQNGDLDLVVNSIDIQYQVGGNIAVILAAVTKTIRERVRLFGEIRVLTTQQRYSSYLISILPFVVAGILFIINPGHILALLDPRIRCIPIGAVIGIVLGHFIIQRLTKIDV
jgi:tight adherence protein B